MPVKKCFIKGNRRKLCKAFAICGKAIGNYKKRTIWGKRELTKIRIKFQKIKNVKSNKIYLVSSKEQY